MRDLIQTTIAAIILLTACHIANAHHPAISFDETTHASDVIFVGDVARITPRVNDKGVVMTDVRFDDVRLIHATNRALPIGENVTLTFAGGEADGLTTRVCGQPAFKTGERWLLFTLHDGGAYANPAIGGPGGMYRIVADAATGDEYPVRADGAAVRAVRDGRILGTAPVESIRNGVARAKTSRAGLNATVRAGGDARAAATTRIETTEHAVMTRDAFETEIRNALTRPLRERTLPDRDAIGVAPVFEPTPETERPFADMMADLRKRGRAVANEPAGADRGVLCACGSHNLDINMETGPISWAAENSLAMFWWNNYLDVYTPEPTDGSWGQNTVNEVGGFATNQDLMDTWGFSYGTAIALTAMTQVISCFEINESDIVYNPAFNFTVSLEQALNNQNVVNFRVVAMHEFGHAWGYITNFDSECMEDYQYPRNSVMHAYYSDIAEDGAGVHPTDAELLRQNYEGESTIPSPFDVGVETYYVNGVSLEPAAFDRPVEPSATLPQYYPEAPITLRNVSVENMSPFAVENVRVRAYVSEDINIDAGDPQCAGYWEFALDDHDAWTGDLATVLPPDLDPGDYWVGLLITVDGDQYKNDDFPQNRRAVMSSKIRINPPPPANDLCADAIDITPGVHLVDNRWSYQDGREGLCVPDGRMWNDVWYRYTPPCDGEINITTCGLNATFDTAIAVYRDFDICAPDIIDLLACNDDDFGCFNGQSEVQLAVFKDQPILIQVGGPKDTDEGTTEMALDLQALVPNDLCVNATTVNAGVHEFNTRCATTDGLAHFECFPGDGQTHQDIWYRWTAPDFGVLVVSACDASDFPTRIVVYEDGGECPPGFLPNCSQPTEHCTLASAVVRMDTIATQTYLIRVGGASEEASGEGEMTIQFAIPCGDTDGNGQVDFADLNTLLENWDARVPYGQSGDVNYDGVVNFDDLNLLLTNWAAPC